jgi:hypothetical protein
MTRLLASLLLVAAVGAAVIVGRGDSEAQAEWVLLTVERGATSPVRTRVVAQSAVGEPLVELSEGLVEARGPSPAPDGRRVVFAGRQADEDPWSLWEVDVTGDGLHEIATDREAREPAYADHGRVVYSGRVDDGWALFVRGPSGTDRLTYRPGDQRWPAVLATGRIVFADRGPEDDAPRRYLWMQQDGTGAELLIAGTPGTHLVGPVREVAPNTVRFLERAEDGTVAARVVDIARLDAGQRMEPPAAPQVGLLAGADRVVDAVTVSARAPISVVDPAKAKGVLFGIDAGLSDRTPNPSAGPAVALRVVSTDGQLGTLPLAADGSYFVEVPADRPLRLETLDASGQIVRGPSDWLWVRPNESRGCVGCHEPRTLAPPNRVPLALEEGPVQLPGGSR